LSEDYLEINRRNWDSRVPIHLTGYDLPKFHSDPKYISDVVRFDLPRLPNVSGLKGIHLQSHIGTDTISLIRLGAKMTALDFSKPALEAAAELAKELGHELETIESDVYSTPEQLNHSFDFVFTGIGALCWLPNISQWGEVVSRLLKPGGFVFLREGHPMLWSIGDSKPSGELVVEVDYFEGQAYHDAEQESYAGEGTIQYPENISFNHGLAEVFNALWSNGLDIKVFEEHRSVPWNPLGDEFVKLPQIDEWELAKDPNRLAASYTIVAYKK
jgi:SAM-dependent methyltransferase